jgi:hypothetical protein
MKRKLFMFDSQEEDYAIKVGILIVLLIYLAVVILFFNWQGIQKMLTPPQPLPEKGPSRDGDIFSDKFEEQFGNQYNHLNPDVYNGAYAILVNRRPSNYISLTTQKKFLIGAGYKPEDIKIVADFTRDSVKQAIDNISKKANENDIVMINVGADGNGEIFYKFKPEVEPIKFTELSDWLSEIKTTEIIILDTCYSGAAIPFLKDGKNPRVIYTQTASDQNGWGNEFAEKFYISQGMSVTSNVLYGSLRIADYSGDGYVSVGESGKYASIKTAKLTDEKGLPIRPQMSDESGIADYLFIAEKPAVLELEDTYRP